MAPRPKLVLKCLAGQYNASYPVCVVRKEKGRTLQDIKPIILRRCPEGGARLTFYQSRNDVAPVPDNTALDQLPAKLFYIVNLSSRVTGPLHEETNDLRYITRRFPERITVTRAPMEDPSSAFGDDEGVWTSGCV